jgi:DNA methylase
MIELRAVKEPLGQRRDEVTFDDWVRGRRIDTFGTNAGADVLPFQRWRHFKESFAPELVERAISESSIPVHVCLDPFGGSGTTPLACQFLGVRPITIEVNPFLADLIESKLARYDVSSLAKDFATLIRTANRRRIDPRKFYADGPPTLIEPGIAKRWIFDAPLAARLAAYVASLPSISCRINRRLLRVLLGGILIELSNVVISGKGRRYRRNWQEQESVAGDLDDALCQAVENAVGDILRYAKRAEYRYSVMRGDARRLLEKVPSVDLAVFSPPYPNSFDYTDVYNVELWALKYLTNSKDNTRLRQSTLSSHVQIKRAYSAAPGGSPLLAKTLRALKRKEKELWDMHIPDMVGGYFADMDDILRGIAARLNEGGQIWLVVGDSKYANVRIAAADILAELSKSMECRVVTKEPFRSMRTSAQQGGSLSLNETLLVLRRR